MNSDWDIRRNVSSDTSGGHSASRWALGIPSLFWTQNVFWSTGSSGEHLYGLVQTLAVFLMLVEQVVWSRQRHAYGPPLEPTREHATG